MLRISLGLDADYRKMFLKNKARRIQSGKTLPIRYAFLSEDKLGFGKKKAPAQVVEAGTKYIRNLQPHQP